jgi:hypothetical protein
MNINKNEVDFFYFFEDSLGQSETVALDFLVLVCLINNVQNYNFISYKKNYNFILLLSYFYLFIFIISFLTIFIIS